MSAAGRSGRWWSRGRSTPGRTCRPASSCRGDRMFTPDFQRRVTRDRLGIEPDEMDGGHYVSISRPRELAERLDAYRRQHG